MNNNLEWPVEINILIPKAKGASVIDLAMKFKLEFAKASPLHTTGITTLGLKKFPVEYLSDEEFVTDSKAVGFSVLDHFLSDTDHNIPEAWGDDHLYGGDIFINKKGVKFLVKISKGCKKIQFIPIAEKPVFHPNARFICLASSI